MEKTIEFTIPGIKGKMTGVYDGRSDSVVIVGVDTAVGFALANSMKKAGFGAFAFGMCNSLDNVTIPGNVISIGESAFFGSEAFSEKFISEVTDRFGELPFEEYYD